MNAWILAHRGPMSPATDMGRLVRGFAAVDDRPDEGSCQDCRWPKICEFHSCLLEGVFASNRLIGHGRPIGKVHAASLPFHTPAANRGVGQGFDPLAGRFSGPAWEW